MTCSDFNCAKTLRYIIEVCKTANQRANESVKGQVNITKSSYFFFLCGRNGMFKHCLGEHRFKILVPKLQSLHTEQRTTGLPVLRASLLIWAHEPSHPRSAASTNRLDSVFIQVFPITTFLLVFKTSLVISQTFSFSPFKDICVMLRYRVLRVSGFLQRLSVFFCTRNIQEGLSKWRLS